MDVNQLIWVPVAINGVGLVGLAFAAGRYAQRIYNVEESVAGIKESKTDVVLEKLNGQIVKLESRIEHLTDSLDTAYEQLRRISDFLMMRQSDKT